MSGPAAGSDVPQPPVRKPRMEKAWLLVPAVALFGSALMFAGGARVSALVGAVSALVIGVVFWRAIYR